MAKRTVPTQSGRPRRAADRAARPVAGTPAPRPATSAKAAADGRERAPRATALPAPANDASAPFGTRAPGRGAGGDAAPAALVQTAELSTNGSDAGEASSALPSSLDFDQRASAARSGRAELEERYREHNETGPTMTAGDIDADWEAAYSVGDEAPGGDNPTPGQDVVAEVGKALGVEYADEEELKGVEKIDTRDRHRWELDPASAEDYPERTKGGRKGGPKK
jgi:Family of unknown function (DUF6335)